jgi:hypothetical protein
LPTKGLIWHTKARKLVGNFLVLRFGELVDEEVILVY